MGGGGENEEAVGALGHAEFIGATEHPLAFDAPEFADFNFEIRTEDSTWEGEWDFIADRVIFGAADDLSRGWGTVVDLADAEAIGIGMLE